MRRKFTRSAALAIITILFANGPALANCIYNGQIYPEGTRIGLFVCENGQWVARP